MTKLLTRLAVTALLVLAACGQDTQDPAATQATPTTRPSRIVRVETERLDHRTFDEVVEVTGAVEASNDAVLSSQGSGTVEYLAPLGRRVRAGQSVARLDARLVSATLQQAEAQREAASAQLALAEDTYKRQEALYRDSVISATEYEQVRTQLNQAKAQLSQADGLVAQANEQVAYSTVRAPFSGTVEEHYTERGEQIMPGTPVARVVDTRRVRIRGGVPERYAGDITTGSDASVELAAYGLERLQGRIDFVGSVIDSDSRTFPVEIEINNTAGKLKPQMIARIFLTRLRLENVIAVPQGSVLRDETGNSVYVVSEADGGLVAERRQVTLGPSHGGRTVVTNGLAVGDELIVAGHNNVSPGDQLQVIGSPERPPSDAISAALTDGS